VADVVYQLLSISASSAPRFGFGVPKRSASQGDPSPVRAHQGEPSRAAQLARPVQRPRKQRLRVIQAIGLDEDHD
jgi:hypothetical protein